MLEGPARCHLFGPNSERQERRRHAKRRHVMLAGADERCHAPRAAIRIQSQPVVPERRRDVGQFLEWWNDDRSFLDCRSEMEFRAASTPLRWRSGLLSIDRPLIHGVGEQYHRARLANGFDERCVGFLRGNRHVADLRAERPVRLEKREIDSDDLGRRATQIIDEARIDDARPRPATKVRREIADGRVVELDEHDVFVERRRVGGPADAPVVRPQLGRIEDTRPREQQDEPCGAETEAQTSEEFARHDADALTEFGCGWCQRLKPWPAAIICDRLAEQAPDLEHLVRAFDGLEWRNT